MNKTIITIMTTNDNRNGSKRRKDNPIIFLLFHIRLFRAAIRLSSVFIQTRKWYKTAKSRQTCCK